MARNDSVGLFWEDSNAKHEKQEVFLQSRGWECIRTRWYKASRDPLADWIERALRIEVAYKLERGTTEVCVPPDRTWELPGYLPHLEVAKAYQYNLLSDQELLYIVHHQLPLEFDIECYVNYFLIAFKHHDSGKVLYFESIFDSDYDRGRLLYIMQNCLVVSFNGLNYDIPIAEMAIGGCTNVQLKEASDLIIQENQRPYQIRRKYKVAALHCNHIDIKELPQSFAGLKIYGGRVHTKRMQDLPFDPICTLTEDQITITRWYCINDLDNTYDLKAKLTFPMELRSIMSKKYRTDLRSKSDAQIAEAVISKRALEIMGSRVYPAKIDPGTVFKYDIPDYMTFKSPLMKWVLEQVKMSEFVVGDSGKVGLPEQLKALRIDLGYSTYTLGIGGLHSTEKAQSHVSDEMYLVEEEDVESYYPRIIINQKLAPTNLGAVFMRVYEGIVNERLRDKFLGKNGDAVAESNQQSLKIVINGGFGKFGSPYSILYAPKLLIQTTISGQLSLLMLIEELELRGINVVSGNTDGIVVKKPRARLEEISDVVRAWEAKCGFKMENTPYSSIHSSNVNCYIAIKPNGKTKVKGSLGPAGITKNPNVEVCVDAVTAYLTQGKAIADSIRGCRDITKFLSVRMVNGGAVKLYGDNTSDYYGKAIRWYYSNTTEGNLIYAKTGKKVPKSEGAKCLMELPDDRSQLPDDLDYDWYIEECHTVLASAGWAVG